MAQKGMRKLVDVSEGSTRIIVALRKFLGAHRMRYQEHLWDTSVRRFYVHQKDVRAARAALPALQQLCRGEIETLPAGPTIAEGAGRSQCASQQ